MSSYPKSQRITLDSGSKTTTGAVSLCAASSFFVILDINTQKAEVIILGRIVMICHDPSVFSHALTM